MVARKYKSWVEFFPDTFGKKCFIWSRERNIQPKWSGWVLGASISILPFWCPALTTEFPCLKLASVVTSCINKYSLENEEDRENGLFLQWVYGPVYMRQPPSQNTKGYQLRIRKAQVSYTYTPHKRRHIGQLGIWSKCDTSFHLIRTGLLEYIGSAWI